MSHPISSVKRNPSLKIVQETLDKLENKSWFNLNVDLKNKNEQIRELKDIKVKISSCNDLIKTKDDLVKKLALEPTNAEILFKGGVFSSISIGQGMLTKLKNVATLTHEHVKAIYNKELRPFMDAIENEELNINATDSLGRSALMYAAMYGYLDMTESLLKNGADVNMTNDGDLYFDFDGVLYNRSPSDNIYSSESKYTALKYAISSQYRCPEKDYIKLAEIILEHMTIEAITKATKIYPELEQTPLKEVIKTVINNKKKESMTAFLLGTHPRVGGGSDMKVLPESGIHDPNSIREIFEYTGWMKTKISPEPTPN